MRALLLTFGVVAIAAAQQTTSPAAPPEPQIATVRQYCGGCHNDRMKAGSLSFDGMTAQSIGEHADVFEKAVRKLRGRLMPPPGSRQPDQKAIDTFVTWLETSLDAAAVQGRTAGYVPIQRLTRTEFATSVNDLLGVELDAVQLLPA